MASELPATIGPYRVLRRLGEGGMAEVFLAVAHGAAGFEKQVALKRLRPELRGDARLERLLVEEARMAARLSHQNLVSVHDLELDSENGSYYVVLDAVQGCSLRALLQAHGRLPPELALFVAEQVATGLRALHAARDEVGPLGLVHRDVSPSNVLLSTAGEVRLADFGLAKATQLQTTTRANVLKGTYAYMSPEQVGGASLSFASDQFSLATTVYEMIAGARPFEADSVHATMEAIRNAVVVPLDGVAGPLLARCHEKQPAARFPSTEALIEAIASARRSLPLAGAAQLAPLVGV